MAKIFWVQANNSIICGYFCIGFIDFILQGKKLTDFTSIFSPHVFKINDRIILDYFKHEWNWQNKLDWLNRIQISEIAKIENYFNLINQRKSFIKKLSKYATTFDYLNKVLIFLRVTSGAASTISFAIVVRVPIGIARASFTFILSVTTGKIKKLLSITRNRIHNSVVLTIDRDPYCQTLTKFLKELSIIVCINF